MDILIGEAHQQLSEVTVSHRVAREVAILRDRVAFEAGEPIDWSSIDATYELVIGGVEAYSKTVVQNLDKLLAQEPSLPERLADAVRQNCTSSNVLQGMGLLYLRRAEKRQSTDPLSDSQRAYAIFNACRLLERSWLGTEVATTSYHRARAIVVGASLAVT